MSVSRHNAGGPTLGEILRAAASFGLLFGLLAGLELYALAQLDGGVVGTIFVRARILWTEPLCNLILFVLLGLALAIPGRWVNRLRRVEWFLGAFLFVSFLGLTFFPARLTRIAALVLAAGLTVFVMRLLRPRTNSAWRLLVRGLPAVTGAWLLVMAGVMTAESWQVGRRIAALPPASAEAPNVLLIVLDTLRADRMSLYGNERPTTPHLDRLAESSLVFTRAVSPSSWTVPAHASLFTGLHHHEHGTSTHRLPADLATLAQALSANGYLSAGFVANAANLHRGLGFAAGFSYYEDVQESWADVLARSGWGRRLFHRVARRLAYYDLPGRRPAEQINRAFLDWLDAAPGNPATRSRPFFAFLNYFDTHDPYLPPEEFAIKFSADPRRITRRVPPDYWNYQPGRLSAEAVQIELDAYDACVAYLDAQLGRLFQALRERTLLEKTLIVITSDHGEGLSDHGRMGHSHNLYREAIHVPLIMRLPAVLPEGKRDDTPVDLTFVAPAILGLAQVSGRLPGVSLDVSATKKNARSFALSEVDADLWKSRRPEGLRLMRAVVAGRWQMIRHPEGRWELYDWHDDPRQVNNLAETEAGREIVQALEELLPEGSDRP